MSTLLGDKREQSLFKDGCPHVLKNAAELRKHPTNAENVLWQALRKKQLLGIKFRRQHAIGRYIADFYCHEKKLVIEVDGSMHENHDVHCNDEARTKDLYLLDLRVLRFTNEQVLNHLPQVLESIISFITIK